MNYNGGRLRDEEIRSILEVRIALETLAVRLLMTRTTPEDIHSLYEKAEKIKTADSITKASEAAFDFQHELAFLSGNTLLPLIFHSFKVAVLTLWERFCTLYGIDALYNNSTTLITLIHEGNPDSAIQWINESVDKSIHGSRPIYYS